MNPLARAVADHGGLIATHELHDLGMTRRAIRSAVEHRALVHVRKGWYAAEGTSPQLIACSRLGGRATCLTAAEERGLWVPQPAAVPHVAVPHWATQLRSPRDPTLRLGPEQAKVHWTGQRPLVEIGGSRLLCSPVDMIIDLAACQNPETTFVVLESALSSGVLDLVDREQVLDLIPGRLRVLLSIADRRSGSGTESLFLFRARGFGISIRQQVQIGPDRVDFLLGDRLVVEVDSRAFHERGRDAERDARLGIRGYRVLRFSYRQIVHDWPAVEAAVGAALARGDHQR